MKLNVTLTLLLILAGLMGNSQSVTVSFDAPDSVCVGEPVNVKNTSTGASNYYWSFCSANLEIEPEIQNLGNVGGLLNLPVFLDYVFTNNKYYGFVTNYKGGNLVRLDYGSSLLNTPVATNLGNFNGILPTDVGTEGIQIVQNEGKWYAIIVSGYPPSGSSPKVVRIAFGTNIENNNPVATDWGNMGNMYQPIDLQLFQENNVWYGLTVNAENNTITRFNFTSSFENTPTATNLGNIGNLAYPTGLFAVNDNGVWRVFVTNGGDNTRVGGDFSLTRLDFGNSLLNDPVGTNLGNLSNMLGHPRDLTIIRSCDQIIGFVVNGHPGYNNMVRINFNNDLTSQPEATTLTIDQFQFPHSISKLFRVNEDVYGFVTDAQSNTIGRIRFPGCNNASVPSSTSRDPAPIQYNAPGTYNINLAIDIGLPTQNSFCKQVVVQSCTDEIIMNNDTAICAEQSMTIRTYYAKSYQWSPSTYLDNATSATPTAAPQQTIKYYVDAVLWDNSLKRDSITITVMPAPNITVTEDTLICRGAPVILNASGGTTYLWSPAAGLSGTSSPSVVATPATTTTYRVRATALNGCFKEDSVRLTVRDVPLLSASGDLSICEGDQTTLIASGGDQYVWQPAAQVSNPNSSSVQASPAVSTEFSVTITENTCGSDTTIILPVQVHINPVVTATSTNDINCTTPTSQLNATGALTYLWNPAAGVDNSQVANPIASIDSTTRFEVIGTNEHGCSASAFVTVAVEKGGIPYFLVPNAFTPNADGRNDCFGLKRWGNVSVKQFTIYNRWGQVVFETNDPSACWDGTFNGVKQQSAGYVYVIDADTFCGPVRRRGIVTLIR